MKKDILSKAERKRLSSESRARKRERRQLGPKPVVVEKTTETKKTKKNKFKKAENAAPVETVKNLQMSLQFKNSKTEDQNFRINDALTKPVDIHPVYNENLYRMFTYYGQGMMANYRKNIA